MIENLDKMILDGLYLMLIGMGVVVGFLTVLVILLQCLKKIVSDDILTKTLDEDNAHPVNNTVSITNNDKLAAIISAAIQQFKQQKDQKY